MTAFAQLPKYTKVYALGDPRLHGLLAGEIEVTEKVDGAQFRFGKFDGKVCVGSHEVNYFEGQTPDAMFEPAVTHIRSLDPELLPEGVAFFAETLYRPKTNTIAYTTTPKNHIVLFGAGNFGNERPFFCGARLRPGEFAERHHLSRIAESLSVDAVPVLFVGPGSEFTREKFDALVTTEHSYLGGSLVEGVVIKNYGLTSADEHHPGNIMAGKYVRESFKEENKLNWGTQKDILGRIVERFSTTARWEKAVSHVREAGALTESMKDMVPLLAQLESDLDEEIKPIALEMLWGHYRDDILRGIRKGLPQWYKDKLAAKQFEEVP